MVYTKVKNSHRRQTSHNLLDLYLFEFQIAKDCLKPWKGEYNAHQSRMDTQKNKPKETHFFFSDGAFHWWNAMRKDIGTHYT